MKTVTADDKYSRQYKENFVQSKQCNYLRNQQFLLEILLHLKKNEAHSLVICDVVDSERLGYLKVLVLNFLVLKGFKNLGFK